MSLLLSATYTAVNLYLELVTDDHENSFLDALVAGVKADLGPHTQSDLRSGPAPVTKET